MSKITYLNSHLHKFRKEPEYKCDLEEYNNYFTDGAHFKHTTSKYLRLSIKNFFNELP